MTLNPTSGWRAYVIPIIVVTIVVIGLGMMVHNQLKKLDMLETLKSVD